MEHIAAGHIVNSISRPELGVINVDTSNELPPDRISLRIDLAKGLVAHEAFHLFFSDPFC